MSKSKIKQAFSHKKQAESAGKAGKSAVALLKEVGSAAVGAFLGAGAGRYSMAVALPLVFAGFYYDNWLVRGIGTGMAVNTVVGSAGLSGMGDEAVNRMKSVAGAYKKTTFIDKAQEALGLNSNNEQAVAGLGYYSARKPFAGFGELSSEFSNRENMIKLQALESAYKKAGVEYNPALSGVAADGSLI